MIMMENHGRARQLHVAQSTVTPAGPPSSLLHLLRPILLLFICLTNNEGHNEGGANDVGIVYSTAKCNRRAVSRGPDLLFMADLTGNGNAKLQKRNKV